MKLIDKAEQADWPLGLTREIRLQEAAILRAAGGIPEIQRETPEAERKRRKADARKHHRERMVAALAALNNGVWLDYDPSELPELTEARYTEAALAEAGDLTDAQAHEVERYRGKDDEHYQLVVLPRVRERRLALST